MQNILKLVFYISNLVWNVAIYIAAGGKQGKAHCLNEEAAAGGENIANDIVSNWKIFLYIRIPAIVT